MRVEPDLNSIVIYDATERQRGDLLSFPAFYPRFNLFIEPFHISVKSVTKPCSFLCLHPGVGAQLRFERLK